MTLSALQLDLYRRLHFADTPDTAVSTRITMLLNERHKRLLSSPALRQLREGFGTFASVANIAEYGLPYGIARITAIRELTNDRLLAPMAFGTYRRAWPDPVGNTSTPDGWVPIGQRAVFRRPAGTGVWAASTSAADTTQTVASTVARADGLPRGTAQSFTTTLNGTTRVQIGNGLYDDVMSLTLSAATAGSVTFYDAAAAGNTLAVINAGRRTSRVYLIALVPTPSAVLDYQVDYEHAIVDMANTWDEPLLPEDFHDLLIHGVLMDEYSHRDDTRYAIAEREYKQRLSELKVWLYGHREATQPSRARELAPLGSWYPFQAP